MTTHVRPLLVAVALVWALALPGVAAAIPPTLLSVSHLDRHPSATFSAQRADFATIYLATKPDRATDGRFLEENVKELDILTDSEIQSGRWLDENRIDPGTYWVMLRASADFNSCYIFDKGTLDPACADGFSNVAMLTVPRPAIRYDTRITAYRYSQQADLELIATPLGEKVPYRVCYRMKSRRLLCVRGTLDGYSWESSASDTVSVNTRRLAATTTFTWFIGGKRVAAKRVRVH